MEEQVEVFTLNLDESLHKHKSIRRKMFMMVRRYKYPLVILSGISTIVLGLDLHVDYIKIQKNVALVIGAIITGLSTLMIFWNVEEYWLRNKITEHQLTLLKEKFEFERVNEKEFTQERLNEFFEEYHQIINEQQLYWKSVLDNS